MTRSRQIAVTAIGAVVAIAVILMLVKIVPSRVRPVVANANAANHTEIARGEVVADATTEINQAALAELERMGNYLRT
ncbi:MAG TPA: hypothetical protein VJN70_19055, partial [Gemmatimonadaceae bacterium]|nr:hypothetical protein [Gemmatimonadaceae bacterium]